MAAPYARRQFAGGSISTTIPLAVGANDGSFTLAASTNWPDGSVGPFVIVLDFGNSTQEKVLCSTRSGLVVTVAASGRGYDGTSQVAHNAGVSAQVVHCAQDDDEANQVVNQVLGQANAAKGDILYMLSAAGPNTLSRLGVGSNGSLLSAASGVPAYTLAGTSPAVLQSAGSSVPVWTVLPGTLLARTQYNPVSLTTYSISASSIGGIDTTNLAVAFTVPASGAVIFRFNSYFENDASADNGLIGTIWNVTGSAELNSIYRKTLIRGFTRNTGGNFTWENLVTGLTPAAAANWCPGWQTQANVSGLSVAGQTADAVGRVGPFLVEVIAA